MTYTDIVTANKRQILPTIQTTISEDPFKVKDLRGYRRIEKEHYQR